MKKQYVGVAPDRKSPKRTVVKVGLDSFWHLADDVFKNSINDWLTFILLQRLNVESGKLPARWQWVARIGKETRWLDMPSTSPDRKIGKGEEERNAVDQGRLVEGSQS